MQLRVVVLSTLEAGEPAPPFCIFAVSVSIFYAIIDDW